jgi:predicted transcriptional regulator
MRTKKVQFFTEKEEEFVNILIRSGFTRKVAMALVFLVNTDETTTRAIERGTDMRQPEVSLAMKYLNGRGWVESREDGSANKGRPSKVYKLAMPVSKILDIIEKEKKDETKKQLTLLGKMKDFF